MGNQKAGFWLRVTALTIDEIILISAVVSIVQLFCAVTGISYSQNFLWFLLFYELMDYNYYTLFWLLRGQTPGKMLTRTRLTKVDGSPITYRDVFIRYWTWMVGVALLGIGYFWIAFHRDKRGWNDLTAGTYVIRI